jgi:flagellar basal-body rod modification protein FlgD
MNIAGISGLGGGSSVGAGQVDAELGKQDFLELLVAQLGNQDPLQPMENTEFVAQLAQFSSLEQLMGVNSNIGLLQVAQMSMTNSQVAGLIGKEVEATGGSIQVTGPGDQDVNFDLDGAAESVEIRITTSEGVEVKTINSGAKGAGLNSVTWDGKDRFGNPVKAGSYNVKVIARDAEGNEVKASTKVKGVVTGVSYQNGIPLLEIGDTKIQVGEVTAVRVPGATTTEDETSP